MGKGSAIGTIMHDTTPSRTPHNALHSPSCSDLLDSSSILSNVLAMAK